MNKRTKYAMLCGLLASAMLMTAVIAGCAVKHAADNTQPAPPVTRWEQVNLVNAEIAIGNDGVAQGVIAANGLGALEDTYTAQVTEVQFRVAAWQKELTPLLASQSVAQSNSARIKQLTSSMGDAVAKLVQSGNAGIKNPQNAQQLAKAISSLQTTVSSLTDMLVQLGVISK